jgi:hypothetical protein
MYLGFRLDYRAQGWSSNQMKEPLGSYVMSTLLLPHNNSITGCRAMLIYGHLYVPLPSVAVPSI